MAMTQRITTTADGTAPRSHRAGFALLSIMVAVVLLATGVIAAGAIIYNNFKNTQEQLQARFDELLILHRLSGND